MPNNKFSVIYPDIGVGGGSGGCVMQTEEVVPEKHGGLEAGTDINGMQPCEVLKMILFPYQYPSFTSFYIEGQSTQLEVGQAISGGIRTFKWSTSHSENIKENSISIKDINANTILGSNLANDGQENLDIGEDKTSSEINSYYTWRISGVNTKEQTFSRDFRVYWRARVYWGTSVKETLTAEEIKALENSALKSGYSGKYNFDNHGELRYYFVFYPAEWGNINDWRDNESGFAVDFTYLDNINITNDYGVTIEYKALRTTYQQGSPLDSTIS